MANGSHQPSYVSNLFESDLGSGKEDEEASSRALSSLWSLFPEVQVRAQEEIDSVIGKDVSQLPTFSDRKHMPYIDGIVKEAWRWNSVGPMGLTHKSEEDIYFTRTISSQKKHTFYLPLSGFYMIR
ncbi:hypothetical protein BJX65DRAFT_270213 [Aspergillus insuetus]